MLSEVIINDAIIIIKGRELLWYLFVFSLYCLIIKQVFEQTMIANSFNIVAWYEHQLERRLRSQPEKIQSVEGKRIIEAAMTLLLKYCSIEWDSVNY